VRQASRQRDRKRPREVHALSARKDASRRSENVQISSLTVVRGQDGELTLTLRYSYADRPPSFRNRTEVAKKMLRESLDRLESKKPIDLGFAEDAVRHIRTDRFGM
jgi:hypothetical protein